MARAFSVPAGFSETEEQFEILQNNKRKFDSLDHKAFIEYEFETFRWKPRSRERFEKNIDFVKKNYILLIGEGILRPYTKIQTYRCIWARISLPRAGGVTRIREGK